MTVRFLVAALCFFSPLSHPASAGAADPLDPAREFLARGDTTAAVHWLVRSYRRIEDPSGYILLGRVQRERGTIQGRLRSQQILEEARAHFPGNTEVRMELGRTYFAQRFFPDAVSCFEYVLERDPQDCEARYLLGLYHYQNWKRMNEYRNNLYAARRELTAVIACDTTNADAAFKYLVASFAMEDTLAGDSTRMLRRFPGRPEFWFYRGTLAYEAGRYADCERDFTRGLALLDTAMREAYGYLGRDLPITERNRLDSFPRDERETAVRAYWINSDPDPTTTTNEIALEHIYRMFTADALYSCAPAAKRGWETDRGQAYLKFGAPTSVTYTLGDDNRSGKVEIWTYMQPGRFQQYAFVDEFLNGNPRIPYQADLLLHFMLHAPRLSNYVTTTVPIPGDLDIVTFRDDAMAASVYLAMRIDADSLRASIDLSRLNRLVVRAAWFDTAWRHTGASEDSVWTSDIRERWVGGGHRYDIVRHTRIPFDNYHFVCAFGDGRGAARAQMRGDADAERFVGDQLAVSDILLTAENGVPGASIQRGELLLWPRIDRRYQPGQMLRAYVEVYNLSRIARTTEYDVRYAIYPGGDINSSAWSEWGRRLVDLVGFATAEPAISQTFHRTGNAHEDSESIGIDIGRLAPGNYELVIEFTDTRSGQQALAHTGFSLHETGRFAGGGR